MAHVVLPWRASLAVAAATLGWTALLTPRAALGMTPDTNWDPYEYPPELRTPANGGPEAPSGGDAGVEPNSAPAVTPEHATRHDEAGVLGLLIDAGVPEGAIGAIAWRPVPWLRLSGGGGTNTVSGGIRGGLSLIPFEVGPSLTVSGGHYFEGDASGTVSALGGNGSSTPEVFRHFGYDFLTLQGGVEFGRDHLTLFFHGGVSWIHTTLHDVDGLFVLQDAGQPSLTSVNVTQDPTLTAIVPSLSFGMVAYVL